MGNQHQHPHQLLSNPTILNFILLMGGGIGIFNMLGTQLGQLMCPTGAEQAWRFIENVMNMNNNCCGCAGDDFNEKENNQI